MKSIKPLPVRQTIKILEISGFVQIRQKGSHLFMQHPDGRSTIIPIHTKKIGIGLIKKIMNDSGIQRDEWLELLKKLMIFDIEQNFKNKK